MLERIGLQRKGNLTDRGLCPDTGRPSSVVRSPSSVAKKREQILVLGCYWTTKSTKITKDFQLFFFAPFVYFVVLVLDRSLEPVVQILINDTTDD